MLILLWCLKMSSRSSRPWPLENLLCYRSYWGNVQANYYVDHSWLFAVVRALLEYFASWSELLVEGRKLFGMHSFRASSPLFSESLVLFQRWSFFYEQLCLNSFIVLSWAVYMRNSFVPASFSVMYDQQPPAAYRLGGDDCCDWWSAVFKAFCLFKLLALLSFSFFSWSRYLSSDYPES